MGIRSTRPVTWLLGLAAATIAGCSDGGTTAPLEEEIDVPPFFGFGNGAPSGPHYNLNIIGVPKNKTADMTGDNGHRIFVPLGARGNASKTKIMLCESGVGKECDHLDPLSGFQVLDANGTDGEAKFALPDPDPNNTGTSIYSVYVRPLGTPGGQASNQTCGEVEELDADGIPTGNFITICSIVQLRLDRTKGKQSFIDATSCLLYLYADLPDDDVDGIVRTPIFGDPLVDSWWEWSNAGLKLAQLRFYPVPADVPAPGAVLDCTAKGNGNL
jgi:hypothetical protein